MPNYTLRFANRSQSDQDWIFQPINEFQLPPNYVLLVDVTIDRNDTFQVVVSTDGGNAHVSLSYQANTATWQIETHTPNEWALAQGNGIVTLRCLLEDQQMHGSVECVSREISEIS